MRERGQASVETIALIAVALAVAAALLLGVARFAPPLRGDARPGALGRRRAGVRPARSRPRRAREALLADGDEPREAATGRRCSTSARTCARGSAAARATPRSPARCGSSSRTRCRRTPRASHSAGLSITGQALEIAWLRGAARTPISGHAAPGRSSAAPARSAEPVRSSTPSASWAATSPTASPLAPPRATSRSRSRTVAFSFSVAGRGEGLAVVADRTTPARFGRRHERAPRARHRSSGSGCSTLAAVVGASLGADRGASARADHSRGAPCRRSSSIRDAETPAPTAADIADVQAALAPPGEAMSADAALLALARRHGSAQARRSPMRSSSPMRRSARRGSRTRAPIGRCSASGSASSPRPLVSRTTTARSRPGPRTCNGSPWRRRRVRLRIA